MQITVKKIPYEGLPLHETVEAKDIGVQEEDLKCLLPLTISGRAEKAENTVLVHAVVKTRCVYFCARCLEPVERDYFEEFDFDYELDPSILEIEINDDIRQEMILNVPARILCREDCPGICAGCGVNLNLEKCRCNKL